MRWQRAAGWVVLEEGKKEEVGERSAESIISF